MSNFDAGPANLDAVFREARRKIGHFFDALRIDADRGALVGGPERYVLVRAASLSVEFFDIVVQLYEEQDEMDPAAVAHGLLYDVSHAIGRADARAFDGRMELRGLAERLAVGPVHFAQAGWASVEILDGYRLRADEDFYLAYKHHHSFEADAWIEAKGGAEFPVCTMSAGYSSGWLSESTGVALVATELSCRACGGESCRFVMAHPERVEAEVEAFLEERGDRERPEAGYAVPGFFERKRIEAALLEQQAQYRGVFEASSDGLLVASAEGEVVAANEAAVELLGRRREALVGRAVGELLGDSVDRGELLGPMGSSVDYQTRACLRAGSGRAVEVQLQARRFRFQGQPHLLVSLRDVTQEERMREQLHRADRLASLGQLAAGVAHEINNPLAYIISNLEVSLWALDADEPLDRGELRRAIGQAKKGAERVKRTVRDLTNFSHGGLDDSVEPVDVHAALELAIQIVKRTALEQGGRIEVDYAPGLPPAIANVSRLNQVFLNLLLNAAQALEPEREGSELIEVCTQLDEEGWVVVEIRDTGRGIPEEIRDKIFDPFYTTKAVGEGTGIGLSICHEIVQAIGGEIDLRSEVGEGSVFILRLPTMKAFQGA